ncbi:MAG TPA: HAD-IA family hydrolase [Candidatus Angelobacter sp.]|nr:HAD-IA family hydrolase [Candidatus Angelobacter sp.]
MPLGDQFRLIIFDCDGVLVDSELLVVRLIVSMVGELGLKWTEEEALPSFRGGTMADCITEIERRLGKPVRDSFVSELRARMAEVFKRELRAVEGIQGVVEELRIPICVASNGPLEKIRLSLAITGLLPRFAQSIFSAYEIGIWKPDPGLFLHAARTMGVPAHACAVVEDSVPGVKAGVAAGMTVFGFSGGTRDEELSAAGAITFRSMVELPQLLELTAPAKRTLSRA